jgi:hypothetical protein
MQSDAIEQLYAKCQQQMLGTRHAEMLRREEEEREADVTISFTQSPAGRRALRGVPAIGGTGGLDIRQDPLRYLLDCERDPRLRV